MITYWETAPQSKTPIVAYSCYKARLSVFQREQVKMYIDHIERLPYTLPQLQRRYERGADVPTWFQIARVA